MQCQGDSSDCQALPTSLYWGWTFLWPVILRNMLKDRTMQRRTLGVLVTFALSLLATPLAAEAQQATQMHRIGWLSGAYPPSGPDSSLEAFQ